MTEGAKWQLVAAVAAAALAVFAAVRWLDGRDPGPNAGAPVRVRAGPAAGSRRGGTRGGGLYVHVAGAVERPGLYRVPGGSRVAAAVERAGGALRRADLTAVNLAAPVEDGQQVIVPVRGPAGVAAAGAASAAGPPSLATATADQLDELDGIGPTLAERIIEYRDSHGGFRSIDELREVEGIGEKRFEALKEALRP